MIRVCYDPRAIAGAPAQGSTLQVNGGTALGLFDKYGSVFRKSKVCDVCRLSLYIPIAPGGLGEYP